MPKKHLLYIHDERFENEPAKSGLVNRLLREHYVDKSVRKSQDQKIYTALGAGEEELQKIAEEREIKFCKHGYAVGMCKFGCKK